MTKPMVGLHVSPGGVRHGITEMHRRIVEAGGQVVLTSAGDNGACIEALQYDPTALTILRLRANAADPRSLDTPLQSNGRYYESAESYRQRTLEELALISDFDRRTFLGQFNEPDKEQVEYLAAMAVALIPGYIEDGLRTAWWGWSSGEPEYDDWLGPNMVAFLRLAEQHPDYVMICLHEYSYSDDLMNGYPYLVGRWQFLRDACAEIGVDFSKLNIVIKEFGWHYTRVPAASDAMPQIDQLWQMESDRPACTYWYSGSGYANIAQLTQKLIAPTADWISLTELPDRPHGENIMSKSEVFSALYGNYSLLAKTLAEHGYSPDTSGGETPFVIDGTPHTTMRGFGNDEFVVAAHPIVERGWDRENVVIFGSDGTEKN